MYDCGGISLNSPQSEKCIRKKVVEKIRHILWSMNFFSSKVVPFVEQCGKILESQTGDRWQYNKALALWILDN